jgi:hypothetical protein
LLFGATLALEFPDEVKQLSGAGSQDPRGLTHVHCPWLTRFQKESPSTSCRSVGEPNPFKNHRPRTEDHVITDFDTLRSFLLEMCRHRGVRHRLPRVIIALGDDVTAIGERGVITDRQSTSAASEVAVNRHMHVAPDLYLSGENAEVIDTRVVTDRGPTRIVDDAAVANKNVLADGSKAQASHLFRCQEAHG